MAVWVMMMLSSCVGGEIDEVWNGGVGDGGSGVVARCVKRTVSQSGKTVSFGTLLYLVVLDQRGM